jgi:hypothetical protein
MAISSAQPAQQVSDSDGIADVNEKNTHHQEIENASSNNATPIIEHDFNSGKLTKDMILAYIVSATLFV